MAASQKIGIRYDIVSDETPEYFVSQIHDHIHQGYKLHGGLVVDNGTFYQALTKAEDVYLTGGRMTRKSRKGRKALKSRKSRK
jgi:hypothetical protein